MLRSASALTAAFLTLSLVACSEQAAITTYFEDAQTLAEGMVETSGKFETLMNVQEDPLQWSDAAKQELVTTLETMRGLRADAAAMSVPEAFVAVHPLLVQSLDKMIAAIEIIDGIAKDPSQATMARANEMTALAEEGERLATEYVTTLDEVLEEKFPEMLEE